MFLSMVKIVTKVGDKVLLETGRMILVTALVVGLCAQHFTRRQDVTEKYGTK